jgi:photosystem II stability/assembly factor-like uncharacterized protein
MHFFKLSMLFSMLTVSAPHTAVNSVSTTPVPIATNIIYQSKDGGQTWQDVSFSLPENTPLEDFFAGESNLYMRTNSILYRSKNNLNSPLWEKEQVPNSGSTIVFNRLGAVSFDYKGQVYQRKPSAAEWKPIYTNFKQQTLRTVFETADGTVFLGSDNGLFRSTDQGQSWKQVQNQGWTMDMVESEGVLIATGQKGIMRSTDSGEHWEWVISEGGVGIAVEKIKGGFAAIAYNTKTKSRRIHVSLDNGNTWQVIDGLQPSASISSIKQVGRYLICGHPDGIFRTSDLGKTWTKVHSSVDQYQFNFMKIGNSNPVEDKRKVFKIYVSGEVVYAVAREFGC